MAATAGHKHIAQSQNKKYIPQNPLDLLEHKLHE